MKFRYTVEELEKTESTNYLSDNKLLLAIINERQSSCTNIYSPLYKRLQQLKRKLEAEIKDQYILSN